MRILKKERSSGRRSRVPVVATGVISVIMLLAFGPAVASHLNVRSSDIVNGQVKTPDLGSGAVKSPKIANGAVGSNKIAKAVPGLAVAGVDFSSTGTLSNWFNRFGGAPNINHPSAGVYEISFPGLQGRLGPDAIVVATLKGNTGTVRQFSGGSDNVVSLRTYNSAFSLTDRAVNLVVMYRS